MSMKPGPRVRMQDLAWQENALSNKWNNCGRFPRPAAHGRWRKASVREINLVSIRGVVQLSESGYEKSSAQLAFDPKLVIAITIEEQWIAWGVDFLNFQLRVNRTTWQYRLAPAVSVTSIAAARNSARTLAAVNRMPINANAKWSLNIMTVDLIIVS
jgi:hypothetical protein